MSLEIIALEGTPFEMGGRHGQLLAEGARAMCETRIDLSLRASGGMSRDRILALAGESLPVFEDFAPDTYAEFCGIAEGAGVSREELLIGNGYTDFVDLVRLQAGPCECTAFGVCPQASGDGALCVGQTWDMNATAFPHVVAFRRTPRTGPASVTLTTAGCLSLIGLNEHGIAAGNTNLVPHDARAGVMYLGIIHTALAQTSFQAALETVISAPRMSGHFYYLGGPEGELAAVETTGVKHGLIQPEAGLLAHANHYDDPDLARYVGQSAPSENSVGREARMWRLLRGSRALEMETLWGILGDHEMPLCRHAATDADVRTCAAVVMSPARRVIRMGKGNPCESGFVEVSLA